MRRIELFNVNNRGSTFHTSYKHQQTKSHLVYMLTSLTKYCFILFLNINMKTELLLGQVVDGWMNLVQF